MLNAKKRTLALVSLVGAFLFVLAGVAHAKPAGTVSPQEGLQNGTVVTVTGTGFTAGKTLGINECSDQGASTGAGDCDLAKIKTLTVDASGKVSGTYTVSAGPFGAILPCLDKRRGRTGVARGLPHGADWRAAVLDRVRVVQPWGRERR